MHVGRRGRGGAQVRCQPLKRSEAMRETYWISPPLSRSITLIGSDMNGKLIPCMDLPLHLSFLALHLTFVAGVHPVQSPLQSGGLNVAVQVPKNLCWGLIGWPHASYVTNTSSISRDICSNLHCRHLRRNLSVLLCKPFCASQRERMSVFLQNEEACGLWRQR